MLREEKGITLVALIITIIVLIILAAVTIMSFKDSKLINTAVNGAVNYANAQEYEMKAVNYTVDLLDEKVSSIEKIQQQMLAEQGVRDSISKSIEDSIKAENPGA